MENDCVINLMNQTSRIVIFFSIIMLFLALLPALTGTGMVSFIEDDDTSETDDFSFLNNIPSAWTRIPIHQLSILFRLGISIFTLFVVYLGGRSKHRRFNDRTIDANHILRGSCFSLKAALNRAVFNFLNPWLSQRHHPFIDALFPILNPYIGGSKSCCVQLLVQV
jgi:hypothetical protein